MKRYDICLLAFALLALLALNACKDDKEELINEPLGEREILFQLELIDGTGATRAITNEDAIDPDRVYILSFTDDGTQKLFAYSVKATHILGTTYKAELTFMDKEQSFMILTSCPDPNTFSLQTTDNYKAVLAKLLYEVDPLTLSHIPMCSRPTPAKVFNKSITVMPEFNDVKMFRMMAKINVINENGKKTNNNDYYSNFKMEGVSLCNYPLGGYLGFDDADVSTITDSRDGSTHYYLPKPYPWKTATTISLSDTPANYSLASDTAMKERAKTIYTFEKEFEADQKSTFIVIKGKWSGQDGSDTPVDKEYRVHLPKFDYTGSYPFETVYDATTDKTYGPTIRNHHYTIRIQRALVDKMELRYSIERWNLVPDTLVLDTVYHLSTSKSKIEFKGSRSADATQNFSLYSHYQWNYKIYDKERKEISSPPGWLTINLPVSKAANGYYPRVDKKDVEIVAKAWEPQQPDTCYIEFTSYEFDDENKPFKRSHTEVMVTVREAIPSANCYLTNNLEPQELYIPMIGQVNKAIQEGFLPSGWLPDLSTLSARVYWTDLGNEDKTAGIFGSSKGVVESCSIITVNGHYYIVVKNGTGRGNAGIILHDDANNIYWSWHIWNIASSSYYVDASVDNDPIMHRNLGAIVADDGNWREGETEIGHVGGNSELVGAGDVQTIGFLYQWGRKDPFPSTPSWLYSAIDQSRPSSIPKTEIYFPNGGEFKKMTNNGPSDPSLSANIQQSLKNPMNAYMPATAGYDWLNNAGNVALWSEKKTAFDPCPYQYRVASKSELYKLKSASEYGSFTGWSLEVGNAFLVDPEKTDNEKTKTYTYGQFNKELGFYYPAVGIGLDWDGASGLDYVTDRATHGYYWLVDTNGTKAETLHFSGRVVEYKAMYRAYGLPVRCVRKEY